MISKNAKCPCGSNKQYKRCCENNPDAAWKQAKSTGGGAPPPFQKSTLKIATKYPSFEVIKLLSLLQLQPQNHGKNIRLERVISEAINNIDETPRSLDFGEWRRDVLAECPKDYREDPAENFFTENIVFANGNNVVYPGTFVDIVETTQHQINSILAGRSLLPAQYIEQVEDATILLLHLQDTIAKRLHHQHRYFEEIKSQTLYVPSNEVLAADSQVMVFTLAEIQQACHRFQIPDDTIDAFVFNWRERKINHADFEQNELFQQPFIRQGDDFILAIPTAIMQCLIEYRFAKAKQYGCEKAFVKGYADSWSKEVFPMFSRMNWHPVSFDFPILTDAPQLVDMREGLFQVDNGCYVYTLLVTQLLLTPPEREKLHTPFSEYMTKRIEKVMRNIKISYPSAKVMLFPVFSRIGYVADPPLKIGAVKKIGLFYALSTVELMVLINAYKFDKLTLWKFTKYYTLATQKLTFPPLTSKLAIYDYFIKNESSFFDSKAEVPNHVALDFSIASSVRRKGMLKIDRIGIMHGYGNTLGFIQCIRKEEHYPVYVSLEIYVRRLRSCLLKYHCPIWAEPKIKTDFHSDLYINAILYWLNEMHDDLDVWINQMGPRPILLEVALDERFSKLQELQSLDVYDDMEHAIAYTIDVEKRHISFTIPVEMVQFFAGSDNRGEQILMDFLLDIMGQMMSAFGGSPMTPEQRQDLIEKYMPLGPKKMLLLTSGDYDIKIADIDIPSKRYIQDSDISYLLENQLQFLKLSTDTAQWLSRESKKELLNNLVELHYNLVMERIKVYKKEALLIFLLRRYEALLQAKAFRQMNYPAKLACYSQFYDVQEEFRESEKDIIESSLSLRVLIEFAVIDKAAGNIEPSDDDIDLLSAHVIELVNYASLSDSVNLGLENPTVERLPSGRLSIRSRERNGIAQFRDLMYDEEIHSYKGGFHRYFKRKQNPRSQTEEHERYANKVNNAFLGDWNITLSEIDMICHAICMHLFAEQKSVMVVSVPDFFTWIATRTSIPRDKLEAFLRRMRFINRENPLEVPAGYEKWETLPWRFNRRLSFLLRPVLSINKSGQEYLILSGRHLLMAGENLMALFFNGILKVDKKDKRISILIAERNKIKGGEYRESVYEWIKKNLPYEVFEYEVKIKPRGFFVADMDKGDVDVLCVDRQNNIVYSIECKNTVQSKLTYDYKMEIDNYLGIDGKEGLITKHVNRHKWLVENKAQVQEKLKLSVLPEIRSVVVSKHILPLKYLKKTQLPIISFFELKTKRSLDPLVAKPQEPKVG